MVRLYIDASLQAAETIRATAEQAHYLGTVMRHAVGATVRLFNGRDGEWNARITAIDRRGAALVPDALVRPQEPDADLWLMFAVLKRDATDLVVRQATELGASALLPVFTERTNAARVNADRLHAIAIEAAEQCERLTIPELRPALPLAQALAAWPPERKLFVAMERAGANALGPAPGPAGLLIGPEGGLGPRDRLLLESLAFVRPVSLGRRILRAETAAIAGLALLQAPGCG